MTNLPFFTLAQVNMLFKAPIDDERVCMEIEQAKQFLRAYGHGKKLDSATIRELYLAGYIESKWTHPEKSTSDGHNRKREASLANLKALVHTVLGKRALSGRRPVMATICTRKSAEDS